MSSGMIDEDTANTIDEGRETLWEFLVTVRNEFRKVFLVFAVGMVATVGAMQYYVWGILRGVTEARMTEATSSQYDILVRTPFDVILLQVKIGMVVGGILALPVLLYYSREGLQRRGIWPDLPFSRLQLVGLGLVSGLLFLAGGAYAYFVFFPVMFNFLTTYTLEVGFAPKYDIVKWTQFIILLSASFGIAGQLPLVMSALSYLDVVTYETFREKWRHAVLGIFLFGAVFSPPDPFTQVMWAIPLITLYGISLYVSKFVTAVKRGESGKVREKLLSNWNRIAGTYALSVGAVYWLVDRGHVGTINARLQQAPQNYRFEIVLEGLPMSGTELAVALGLAWGAALTFPVVVYYAWPELESHSRGLDVEELSAEGVRAAPASVFANLGEEEALNHARQAMAEDDPEKGRAILDRHDAVTASQDEASRDEASEATAGEAAEGAADGDADGDAADPGRPDNMAEDIGQSRAQSAGELAQRRTAGVFDAFTDDETTEEDIGGYYEDIRFILDSLTSRMFRIVGVFMVVMAATFIALYRGGIGALKSDFLSRLPPQVLDQAGGSIDIVALHPVEAILFEVKMSAIAGGVAVLPVLGYYAWPAIEERFHGLTREFETAPPLSAVVAHWNQLAGAGLLGGGAAYYAIARGLVAPPSLATSGVALTPTEVGYATVAVAGLLPASLVGTYHAGASVRERIEHGGKQNVFLVWLVTLVGGLVVGSALGYAFVAPAIISYLVEDAVRAEMIIAYRINNFFWLIFATTVGIGLLADVPLTMWLFHRGGIVRFRTMRERWREVCVAVFGVAAIVTPESLLSMFLMAFPVAIAYIIGLVGLWAWTLPWRVRDRVTRLAGGG
jgi:sec-independent protein translocase protein TatC